MSAAKRKLLVDVIREMQDEPARKAVGLSIDAIWDALCEIDDTISAAEARWFTDGLVVGVRLAEQKKAKK